jgi:RNA polymerase sigma factor (sigma-70 family)
MLARGNGRPSRAEIDRAALALLTRHGAEILATARRYAATLDDAEDAYQRGLEILLTKAPTTAEDELVPWLKTVVKHEAFALRRQRERHTPPSDDGEAAEPPSHGAATHEQAERFERLRQGAEAIGRLKPQEIRALLLKAEGYSYKEICAITGWTYTKVNRCLTEGRKAFLERVAGIEGGEECDRLAPLVSLLADGEASARELRALRPHLKTCLVCRTRLREYRQAPARVAALMPPAALLGQDGGGTLRAWLESLAGAAQHKAAALGERVHTTAELAAGHKVAAVAASAAVLAGGGATVDRLAEPRDRPDRERPADVRHVKAPTPRPATAPIPGPPAAAADPTPAPTAHTTPSPQPPPPPPDPAAEFAPGAQPEAAEPAAPREGGAGSSGGSHAAATASEAGEFGP